MRRLPLQQRSSPAGDSRPALLAVVALMLMLMPLLLLTTSPQKLTSLSLHLSGHGSEALPLRTGAVEEVEVGLAADGTAEVRAEVRRADLGAAEGEVHELVYRVPSTGEGFDLAGIQEALAILKRLDPEHARVHILPADELSTQEVIEVVDAARAYQGKPFFPEVVLEGEP